MNFVNFLQVVSLCKIPEKFGCGGFIFEENFEQQENRKHPYFKTLNCSIVNLILEVKHKVHLSITTFTSLEN